MCPEGSNNEPVLELDEAELLDILRESADEVFWTMIGLVGVLVNEEEPYDDQARVYQASVGFHGSRHGAVKLRSGLEGALDIARGLLMLGEDEEVAHEEILDALGECANLLSGSMKCKALDPAGGFSLGIPEVLVSSEQAASTDGLVYQLSRGCISVEVWVDPV